MASPCPCAACPPSPSPSSAVMRAVSNSSKIDSGGTVGNGESGGGEGRGGGDYQLRGRRGEEWRRSGKEGGMEEKWEGGGNGGEEGWGEEWRRRGMGGGMEEKSACRTWWIEQ